MKHDPFRLRIMKAVTEQLKTICPDNGFDHDLRDFTDDAGRVRPKVFRGRLRFGENDPKPMIAVMEDPRTIDTQGPASKFRVLIQGFVENDTWNPLDPAYHLSADAIEVMSDANRPMNILGMGLQHISAMKIEPPVHMPGSDDVSDTAYFIFGVTFTLIENVSAPRCIE